MVQGKTARKSDEAHPRDEEGRFTRKNDAPKSSGSVKAKDGDSKPAESGKLQSKSKPAGKTSARSGTDNRKSR